MNDDGQEEAWDSELKHRERLYVLHYCSDDSCFLNATAAYKAAYIKHDKKGKAIELEEQVAATNASRLMKKPKIKQAIRALLKLTQTDLDEKNVYKVINNLANLAFYNPADVIKANGKLVTRNLEDLGEAAKAIAQIQPSQYGAKVTLVDRSKYIELLMKYLNIVRPEQQIEIKLPVIEMAPKAESIEAWNMQAEEETNG